MWYVTRLTLILGFLNSLNATTLIKQSLEEIVDRAELVIRGRVVNVDTVLEASSTGMDFEENIPYQYITIEIDDVLKTKLDDTPDEVVIRQMGGSAEGKTLKIDGFPEFREDQEVVLSLTLSSSGYFYVVGAVQGKYDLDGRGNAIPDHTDSMLVRKGNSGKIEVVTAEIEEIKYTDILRTVARVDSQYAQN